MVQVYIPGNENFTSNGDATLFCYNCGLTANLGGSWVLDVTIPIDQEGRWKYLTEEAVLKVDTWQKDKQLYRVAKVEKTESSVSATAYPVFFDSANDAFLLDCRPTGKTGQQALNIMCAGTPYSGESNIGTIATAYFVRRNLMDAINGSASPTFIERWGGEILYDNYKVIINDRVGGDYGVEARYGRNIAGVVYAVDTAEIVTRIVPIAYNGYMMSGKTPWVDSPNVDKFAKVYTREVRYENIRMAQDAGSDEDVISCANQAELDAALRAAAEADFATGIDAPKVTIDIDMLAVLDMASRYEDALKDSTGADVHDTNDLQIITTWYRDYANLEVVRLGDTIRCRHSKLDITTTARVVSITWDCVRGKVTHIVLGDYKYDYIRTINGAINRISNAVREDGSIIAEKVQGFLDGAQTRLRIQNSVADRVNTMAILFEDLDPDSPLYGALGIGTQGICISKTRTADGRDWDWTTGITANGMNASMGVFGILADKLGKNWINLDTGEISLGGGTEIGGKTIVEYMSDADQALAEYIAQNDNRVTLIENQLDGQYDTYFEDYAPTLQNLPASNWTTQALKEEHEGDLFYDKSTGNSYRFFQNNGVWEWTLITDTVAAQALALASEAKDTADGKRRVFTVQPEPPYDEGDIYFTGTEILVCVNPKATGSYATNDFVRKDAYNSQANFEDFVTNYNQTISGLQQDINDRIETWPQATDPSTTWDTTQDHTGDIWYDGDKLYYWDGSAWQEMSAAPTAEIAQSLGRKAQIFITQPTPPYKKGDLWFDSTEVGSADILTCIKDSGSAFAATDWRKCNKYIDDAELEALKNDMSAITDDLQVQIDNKIETYRQATDPALSWATVKTDPLQDTAGNDVLDTDGEQITADYEYIKVLHEGDLWHRTTDNTEWRYHNGNWEPMDVPDSLWSEVNSKRQIFGTQPTPPYAVNDLWVQGETGDILRCKTARESGDYVATDWVLASRYTGREEFEAWLSDTYAPTIEALKEQADGKAETWHQATDPSLDWDDPALHYGDLWYNTTTQESFFWDGDSWQSQSIPLTVFDTIDSKAQIFATEPTGPYYKNDIWFTGEIIKVCVKDRASGFAASDWQKKETYTDDSALEAFLDGDYADTVTALHNQLDGKSETWYQTTDPSTGWTGKETDLLRDTAAEPILDTNGAEITTDWLIDVYEHLGDIWVHPETREQKVFTAGGWQDVTYQIPQEFIDTVDGKAQIFITEPVPPYAVGDLWYTGTVVKVCVKDSGTAFLESDWQKKDYYTDDSAIERFLTGEYADTVKEINNQLDRKIETWYQSNDPSVAWVARDADVPLLDQTGEGILDTDGKEITTDFLREAFEHLGDIWHDTDDGTQWRWSGGGWEEITVPDALIDKVDGKAQVFVGTATPTGAQEKDIWFKGPQQGIFTYVGGQWQEYNKYTSDENLDLFVSATYKPTIEDMQEQLDGKVELWFYAYVPTLQNIPAVDWDAKEKPVHVGDLFYNTTAGAEGAFRFEYDSGTRAYKWTHIEDANITKALADAAKAQDTADQKRRIFTTQPLPPYDKGDMWITGSSENDELLYCTTTRLTGSYNAKDWTKTPTESKAQTILQALNGEIIAAVIDGDIINAINLSSEGTKIDASKLTVNSSNIDINGVISANNYFKVNLDGSIESTKGKFGNIIIDSDKVYTVGHDTATSTTAGFMLHSDGTVSIGNDANFLRFVKDSKTNTWGLQIALDDAAKLVIGDSTAATAAALKNVADTAKGDSDKAAKTATNFLYYDNANGLVISQNGTANGVAADAPAGSTAKPYNTQILGDGIAFREGLKILSKISGSGMVIYRPGSTLAKKMDLTDTGLNFYRNDGTTVVASYTDSGFNVSMGTIGKGDRAFVIDDRSIHNGVLGAANSVFISTGSSADASIAGSPSQAGWALAMGTDFGVTRSGALYAKSVNLEGRLTAASGSVIGAWTITDGSLTNGSMSIGSSGIRMGDNFSVSSSGTVNAKDAHFAEGCTFGGTLRAAGGTFSGELSSATIKSVIGTIGGWTIADRKLHAGNIFLSPGGQGEDDDAVTICDREAKDWVIGAGSNFGVTTGGALYAKSGQIAGFAIGGRELSSTTGVYTAYMRSGSSASTKAFEAVETQPGSDPITHFSVTYGGKLYTDKADFGGIVLEDGAIYAGGHKSYNSSNAGFLLNKDGILSVGDGTNYIRYYKNNKDKWVLDIHASEFTFGGYTPAKASDLSDYATKSSVSSTVDELVGRIDAADSAATDAQTAADAANTAASNAATAASAAQTTANNASTAAGEAKDTAEEALDTAETANGNAANAAKTATNYLSFVQGTGLYVAENKNYNSGAAVLVSSSSVDILKGGNVRASFGDSSINFYRSSGNKAMVLGTSSLTFYKSDGATEAAVIGTSGLEVKGGIIGGFNVDGSSFSASYSDDEGYSSVFKIKRPSNRETGSVLTIGDFSVSGNGHLGAWTATLGNSGKPHHLSIGGKRSGLTSSSLYIGSLETDSTSTKVFNTKSATGDYVVGVAPSFGDYITLAVKSSSSRRYKDHVADMPVEYAEKILDINPIIFRYKDGYLMENDESIGKEIPGFYAEDIEEHFPLGVYHKNGLVENWMPDRIIPPMLKLLQEQHKEIQQLKTEIDNLKQAIA